MIEQRMGRLLSLSDLVKAGQMAPQAPELPMNTMRNNDTGAEYQFESAPRGGQGGQGPQLDYSQPIEIFGQGKGYAIKGQPLSAMINGRRVDYGVDGDASRKATQAAQDRTMKLAEQMQGLEAGALDIAKKGMENSAMRSGGGGKAATEDEKKAAGWALRMESALKLANAVEADSPKAAKPGGGEQIASMFGRTAGRLSRDEPRQRIYNAQIDALDAALTLSTGAAYTREQLEGLHESYFPQYGDKPEAVADKRARLEDIIQTARMRSGRMEGKVDDALRNSNQYGSGDGYEQARAEFEARKAAIAGKRNDVGAQQMPASADQLDRLPDPRTEKGSIITDNSTGMRMQSDGRQWLIIGRGGGGSW